MKHSHFLSSSAFPAPFPFGEPSPLARFEPSPDAHGGYDPNADNTGENYLAELLEKKYSQQGYLDSVLRAQTEAKRVRTKRDGINHDFYFNRELNRLDSEFEYEIRLDERDGRQHLYSADFEEFLPDMIHNWERYLTEEKKQPELFNKAEADAILEMDSKMANGEATSAFYAVSEPYVAGTIRYVNQFVVKDGKVSAQYLDIGKFVRDLDIHEAHDVVNSLGKKFGFDIGGSEHGFSFLISKNTSLTASQIHEAVFEKLAERDGQYAVDTALERWVMVNKSPIGQVRDSIGNSFIQAGKDIRDTFAPVGMLLAADFYHRRKQDKEKEAKHQEEIKLPEKQMKQPKPSLLEKVKKVFTRQQLHKDQKNTPGAERVNVKAKTVVLFEKKSSGHKDGLSQRQELNREINRGETNFMLRLIPSAGETGLAFPILKILLRSEQANRKRKLTRRRLIPPGGLLAENHAGRSKHTERKRKRRKRSGFMAETRRLRVGEKSRLLYAGERVHRKQTSRKERKNISGKRENVLIAAKEIQLFALAASLLQRLQVDRVSPQTARRSKESKQAIPKIKEQVKRLRRERQRVAEERIRWFTISLLLWVLSSGTKKETPVYIRLKALSLRRELVRGDETATGQPDSSKPADPIQPINERSPWLLLAIIWYLAMIREQGMQQGAGVQQKRRKKKLHKSAKKHGAAFPRKDSAWLPSGGIIYLSPSVLK